MKNTTAMADYELRHIEALRKDLAGCTVLLQSFLNGYDVA